VQKDETWSINDDARKESGDSLRASGIAGGGFEPPTSGLWARFAPKTANPAVPGIYI
jgi:hypothetical protein